MKLIAGKANLKRRKLMQPNKPWEPIEEEAAKEQKNVGGSIKTDYPQ